MTLAGSMILPACNQKEEPHFYGQHPRVHATVQTNKYDEPYVIIDIDKDGSADVLADAWKNALYVAPEHRDHSGHITTDGTEVLTGELRNALSEEIKLEQKITTLLNQ